MEACPVTSKDRPSASQRLGDEIAALVALTLLLIALVHLAGAIL